MAVALKFIEANIKDIKPYDKNPRIISQEAIDYVANSIKEFGMKNPILVNRDMVIIAGHTRLKACEALGMGTIPCNIALDLTPEQEKALRLADNKTAEFSDWDKDLLDVELGELFKDNFDMQQFGFDWGLGEDPGDKEITEDEVETEGVPCRCQNGDIWKLGEHTLMCGDSTDPESIIKLTEGAKMDLVFTDPPYKQHTKGGSNQWVGQQANKTGEAIEEMCNFEPSDFLSILPSLFGKGVNAYIFCSKDLVFDYLNWARENKYGFNILFWKKPNALPLGDQHRPDIEYLIFIRKNAIWNNGLEGVNYSKCLEYGRDNSTDHPTIKPVELIAQELQISSNKGSNVADLFGGSGSTLIACEQLGRVCYTIEKDPHYCDVIINRWEKLTGKTAEKIA